MDTFKAADRDMTKRHCGECKHYIRHQYSSYGDCIREEYGPQPDEWTWDVIQGWSQLSAPVVKKYAEYRDNKDGHCPGFEEKPPTQVETPAEPEPTTAEKLVALLYEIVAEAQEA